VYSQILLRGLFVFHSSKDLINRNFIVIYHHGLTPLRESLHLQGKIKIFICVLYRVTTVKY
jgi:hypothetical protein